jgi:hypothetical protein
MNTHATGPLASPPRRRVPGPAVPPRSPGSELPSAPVSQKMTKSQPATRTCQESACDSPCTERLKGGPG